MLHQSKQSTYETTTENLGNVCLSQISKSTQIQLSQNQLTALSGQRHSTVMATHGMHQGKLVFEAQFKWNNEYRQNMNTLTEEEQKMYRPQCRIGISQMQRDFTVPLGILQNSICIRSIDCSIVQNGKRYYDNEDNVQYNEQILDKIKNRELQITDGDFVTIIVDLPKFDHQQQLQEEVENVVQQSSQNEQELADMIIKVCEKQESKQQVINEIIPNSRVMFFVNGILIAQVKDINYTRYYPSASLYNFAQIQFNFGKQNIKINYHKDFYVLPQCLNGGSGFGQQKIDLLGYRLKFPQQLQSLKIDLSKIKLQQIQNQFYQNYQLPTITRKIAKIYGIDPTKLYTFQQKFMEKQLQNKEIEYQKVEQQTTDIGSFNYLNQILDQYPELRDIKSYNILYIERANYEYKLYIQMIEDNLYNQDLHECLIELLNDDTIAPQTTMKNQSKGQQITTQQ